MKVLVKNQAYYALDSRGPRIIEPGSIISVPEGTKLAAWMELIDEPKSAAPEAPKQEKKSRPNAESVL